MHRHPADSNTPTKQELLACLALKGDPRRRVVAAHLLNEDETWPKEVALVRAFLASTDREERHIALSYATLHRLDTELVWRHLEGERDEVLVENALRELTRQGDYQGDPRMLRLLRRVLGPREGRPMIAMHLLHQLIPHARVDIQDPRARAQAWREWLDARAASLVFDKEAGVFVQQ